MHDTYQYLILNNYFNIDSRFICFDEKIKQYFQTNKDDILKKLDELCIQYPKKIRVNLNIYNLSVDFDYIKIKNLITNLNN